MDAETKAALERLLHAVKNAHGDYMQHRDPVKRRAEDERITAERRQREADDAAIRAHIASETSAYEAGKADAVAQVVTWLRQMAGDGGQAFQGRNLASQIAADNFARAVASGAHERNGDD